MIIEKEEIITVNGIPRRVTIKEYPEFLDEKGTQALVDALKAYAQQELEVIP
ncbi:MAG: hypothetical protein J6Y02_03780 [Pseudobutyrivibrio sp.]|nr:hypothetical protein [Pseudobutyrivibrio sp.]